METNRFDWVDYLVFSSMFLVSITVGLYYGWKDKRNASTEEYLMAGRRMHVIPVGCSLFVSWINAITLLADPVEVYFYGGQYLFSVIGIIVAMPIVAHYIAPNFHRAKIVSMFEFLESRFHKPLRYFGSLLSIIIMTLIGGITLYAPAIALSQVSGISFWGAILLIGCVCTFYATLGGMKAVVWADTLQTAVLFAGLIAAVIQGFIDVGGLGKFWEIMHAGKRLDINWSPNLLLRSSAWTYTVGTFMKVMVNMTSLQVLVQRFSTVATPREATLVAYVAMPLFVGVYFLIGLQGLVMYGLYAECDPMKSGKIKKFDQMVPFMIVDVLRFIPGLPGLYMACLVSGAFSTISSGINSFATIALVDMVVPLQKRFWRNSELGEVTRTWLAKIIGCIVGIVVIIVAIGMTSVSARLFDVVNAWFGAMLSPFAGVFILGLLVPIVDTTSAWIGFLSGFSIYVVFVLGVILFGVAPPLVTSVDGCLNQNLTSNISSLVTDGMSMILTTVATSVNQTLPTAQSPFKTPWLGVNPLMLSTVAMITTLLTGYLTAKCRAGRRNRSNEETVRSGNKREHELKLKQKNGETTPWLQHISSSPFSDRSDPLLNNPDGMNVNQHNSTESTDEMRAGTPDHKRTGDLRDDNLDDHGTSELYRSPWLPELHADYQDRLDTAHESTL